MKAIVYKKYGSPDVLQLEDMAKPAPGEGEVLVNVRAAAVNPQDWHLMRADPFLVRLMAGLIKPKNPMLGSDVAGKVEALGANTMRFTPGDEVFGDISGSGFGAFAEYMCAREVDLALKPSQLTFQQAPAVPSAALAALQGLRDHGQIQSGQKVLVNGASGGVGTYAVQIAKSFGADVTGVCSTRNLELVSSLGADHVIDYTQEDFSDNGQRYDLILDNVGNPAAYKLCYRRSLTPTGTYFIVAGSFYLQLFQGPWMTMTGKNKIGTYMTVPNQKDLIFLKELVETGKVVPEIDRRYPLSETADAIRYLEEGHARGKVIIALDDGGG